MAGTEQIELARWSECHSWLILSGILLEVMIGVTNALAGLATVSFTVLIAEFRNRWTPDRGFGMANGVTLLRLCGIILLLLLSPGNPNTVIVMAVVLFSLDGADGQLARLGGLSSEFGEYFDKESDALFMLVLCLLLFRDHRFGMWILIPGLLRYVFVVYIQLARPPMNKETRSRFGRWIYFLMMSALIFCFTPFPVLYEPVVAGMTLILGLSFAQSFRDLHSAEGPD